MEKAPLNLGGRFGKWTVVEDVTKQSPFSKSRRYRCSCECGTVKEVDASSLKKGLSKSCGCNRKVRPVTSQLKMVDRNIDAQLQFELIVKGCLPPADAFSVAEGLPCWSLKSIAEILGIPSGQLMYVLRQRSITPIMATDTNTDYHLSV